MQEERLKPKSGRNEYKAAKGEKVVKKRREDWSTGIPREQGSDHPVCSRFPSHPTKAGVGCPVWESHGFWKGSAMRTVNIAGGVTIYGQG